MKRLLLISFLSLFISINYAQISEDFQDGDFTNNPVWIGNQADFKVNTDLKLQLDMEGNSGISSLQTVNQLMDSVSWEFYIKLSFSPSSNNNARVYLVSNQENLQLALNGYFLQFGESGSSDAIELFRQDGETIISICRGSEGSIASSFNARVKVTHRANGEWILYSDFGNTGSFVLECMGNDQTYHSTNYFGFYCKYTSSNATKFYFDDIEVNNIQQDLEAPSVTSVLISDANSILVSFSEAVSQEPAENTNNYFVNKGLNNPNVAQLTENQTQVLLHFSDNFVANEDYQISIGGQQDFHGNTMADTLIDFTDNVLQEFDVVFSEIMADPSPVVQLPNAEYLEIYNRTTANIDLSGWKLIIGSTEKDFPSAIIPAESYLILCKESNIQYLSEYGTCVGFSSFSLTNGGQSLSLVSASGDQIHSLSYTDDWYRDPMKKDGGWSIEQINPNDFCSAEENWIASEDSRGGSPGTQNSVYNPTAVSPTISSVVVTDNPLLLVTYSQEMQLNEIITKGNYSVSPDIGQPGQIMVYDTSRAVYLSFSETFQQGVQYTLSISGSLHNCANQAMDVPVEMPFMLNKTAEMGDIVFNEIMADPEPVVGLPAYEYLELYNTSNSPIDMDSWDLQIGSTHKLLENMIIAPHQYLILCKNEAVEYFQEYGSTYGLASFSLSNGGTQLVLRNMMGAVIHQVEYDDTWYGDDAKAEGGWSLEAIDPLSYCQEKNNWSASTDDRGGSPGQINSIDGLALEDEDAQISRIEIVSEQRIRVYFSKSMDSATLIQTANYDIDQGVGAPLQCIIQGPKYQQVDLLLNEVLQKGVVYSLETQDGLLECNGTDASHIVSRFAVPDEIAKGDIVFNEILFDAAVDHGEFVELVNISNKILETANLSLSRININQYDTTWYSAELSGLLLFPGDYVAYAPSAPQVLKVYHSEAPERIISLESFPSLPNTNGILILHLSSNRDSIIDYLSYDESMHYSLIKDTKGVSLEKMDLYGGNARENWHSAASSVNYATPAYQNSQFVDQGQTAATFELSPEVFSPDNDGFDDVLQIDYQMDEPGYTLNLVIYDAHGRQVKHLIENELLGTSGAFYWDGQTENHQKAAVGIYILYFEYFDLQGNVKSEKLTTVLGGHL